MKKQVFFLALLSALVLTACSGQSNPSGGGNSQSSSQQGPEIEDLGVKEIHTELQKSYLEDEWTSIKTYVPVVNADNPRTDEDKAKLLGNVSSPLPIKLDYSDLDESTQYFVEVSKYSDFEDSVTIETSENYYNFYNSEIGQEYFFRAAVSEDDLANAAIKKFKVDDAAPRNINVDGVINFRDVGGWKSSLIPNGVVKQGLYYRCAQFDNGGRANITAAGKETLAELGIKLDIDMRDRPPASSSASSDDWEVAIMDAHIASGTESTRFSGFADVYKKIFEAIAVADEAPIALHCTHGADRTGIASFFLLALLGVSKEDCGRDYSFTRFAGERKVWHEDEFDNWVNATEALEGETFADKMFNHLLSKGISEDTLETIREKFVPGYQRAQG